MRSADQRRNSVSDGDAHKGTWRDEWQWLYSLCHRLVATRARCSPSEILQLRCYEGYAMEKCVPGVKYIPKDVMPTACVLFVNLLTTALFNFVRSAQFASLWKAAPIFMFTEGSGPLIEMFLGWKILTDKCSPLKYLWEVVSDCVTYKIWSMSHMVRQWVKLQTVQNSRQFDECKCHIWIVLLRSVKCRLWVRKWAGNMYLSFKPF